MVDSSVWLALAYKGHEFHGVTLNWFESLALGEALFCRLTHLALLRHLSTKSILGPDTLSLQEAWSFFEKLRSNRRVGFAAEPAGTEVLFRQFSSPPRPEPKVVTDAYLAAFAVCGQLTLVTFDRGFSRYRGLTSIHP